MAISETNKQGFVSVGMVVYSFLICSFHSRCSILGKEKILIVELLSGLNLDDSSVKFIVM